jgi:non-ribosomal peptide synthetase-like protein
MGICISVGGNNMEQPFSRPTNTGHVGGEKAAELHPTAQRQPDLNGVHRLAPHESVVREYGNNELRWAPGERLNHLLEEACIRFATNDAIIGSGIVLSYRYFNRRANQLARHLLSRGIKSGDRVAMMFDRSPETYVAMLAVMKVNAAYVPLDAAFPIERVSFILADANVSAIISMSGFAERLSGAQVDKIFLDSERAAIDAQADDPLTNVAPPIEALCYIIYTSGTTGNPKGVGIGHASICNFVRIAAELYGFARGDRIYQGMSIAFDFSVEEIWVPLMSGLTLVPGPAGTTLMGDELGDFLRERRVTVMACCPTLLSTIEQDVPDLRILLVGGEACPQNLVAQWYRPGRRILNTYGPTEATVTAAMTELRPDKPVTIGVPLPTYSIVILDPNEDKTVPTGEIGEIGIAGVGLALGYINRDDLTKKKFIRDFLHIENNPSGKIYRTGDLGRISENGEIDYRGRIDTQVKIRGYRIELTEIEAVLLDLPQVAQAAVTTFDLEEGVVEIVAYYALKRGVELSESEITQVLRSKLPVYMVPAYFEQVDVIPMTLSNKVDYKRLHKPQAKRFSSAQGYVQPKTDRERMVHDALAGVLHTEHVSTEHHFFNDLGANSLLMARVCAAIRRNPGMSNVSMRDIYMQPTISKLAHHLDSSINGSVAAKPEPFHVPSSLSYMTCGALQIGFFAAYMLFGLWIFVAGIQWATATDIVVELYTRSVALGAGLFVALTALPVAAKWLLIGRFKVHSIPIWSFAYFRFWVVKTLMRTSPVAAFSGTPLYNAYLRLMGARIGRNAMLRCQFAPVCTDLVTIGDNTIVNSETSLLGYRAQSNFIHMGPVTIGSNAFIGEGSVLDIDTAMGDNTQLGHASSLQSGQRVPDGKRYHGSPAVETSSDYRQVEDKNGTELRGAIYVSLMIATMIMIAGPAMVILIYHVWDLFCPTPLTTLHCATFVSLSTPLLLAFSAALFFGALGIGLAGVYVVPRLCMRALRPGVTYTNFGFHYLLQSIIRGVSNSQFFCTLFGDSSAIVWYMRYVGWNLNTVLQTGSNMGTNHRHDNPFLCNVGSSTMVSDGLKMMNMQMSPTSFRLAESKIGDNNYLGNDILYPPNGRTGTNVLLGTKTMVPINGPVRENVGLLGSPAFEIPRNVSRDRDMCASFDERMRLARLHRKNVYNFVTALIFLASQWVVVVAALVLGQAAIANIDRFGIFAFFAAGVAGIAFNMVFFIVLERASLGFKRLKPRLASIYDPYFWWHERHWKMSASPIATMFTGTPFRGMLLRALGMKVGAKLFDCSQTISERTLTELGDYANLNEGCSLQAHSLEEGVFKSDHIRLGNRCSVGPGAFVHYGVSTGDDVILDADSFLMKGETLDSNTGWCGNPVKLARRHVARTEACVKESPTPPSETSSPQNDRQGQAQECERPQLGSGVRD